MTLFEYRGTRFGFHLDVGGCQVNVAVYIVSFYAAMLSVGLPLEWPAYDAERRRLACGLIAVTIVLP